MSRLSDVVAQTLAAAGIDMIFGVPGSLSSVELIEASAKVGIRYVLCSNESSAAVMAGTYGMMKNRPGVVSTGVGPGAVAAVHGVANCRLERVPMLVLTDRYGDEEYRRLIRQRLDQPAMFAPVTKASFTLPREAVASTLRRAMRTAMNGRPGPVHVDMPYDVMLADATEADMAASGEHEVFESRAGAGNEGIDRLLEAIEASRKPVVIAGAQVNRRGEGAERAFVTFAEKLGAPVFASLSAKGLLSESHELSVGVFRGVPSERQIIDESDLIVVIGFDAVEIFTPGGWPYPQRTVVLDEVPHLDGTLDPEVEVVANLEDGLAALAVSVPRRPWNREDLDAYRSKRAEGLRPQGSGLMPGAVLRMTREHLADNGIVAVDAGQHKVVASDLWESRRPRGFLSSSGLGSMAVSLPAAISAKLIEPETPVVSMTGDGGFLMRVGDLETAAREGAAVVVVVFNDGWLNLIKLQQDRKGYKREGVAFADVDFAAIAAGFGFGSRRVDTEAEYDAAIGEALASGRPWLIDARINPDGYV
jgi:acetolactate synthase-1/2/3 large subunit